MNNINVGDRVRITELEISVSNEPRYQQAVAENRVFIVVRKHPSNNNYNYLDGYPDTTFKNNELKKVNKPTVFL